MKNNMPKKYRLEEKCLWKDNRDFLDEMNADEKEQKKRCENCNGYELNCKDYITLPC